jgi:hypothetical protein
VWIGNDQIVVRSAAPTTSSARIPYCEGETSMSKLSMLAEARAKVPAREVPAESAPVFRAPNQPGRADTADMPKAANMSVATDDQPDPMLVFVGQAPWVLPLLGAMIALGTASIWWAVLRHA